MNTKLELADKFALMWRSSRESAGKSQDYMAKSLGVSKKTVQNWEAGTSCPSQIKGIEWFNAIDTPALPYYLEVLYGELFHDHGMNDSMSESETDTALSVIIHDLPKVYKEKLLYGLSGTHGSSVAGLMELANAYLQTPLKDRISVSESIITNYEIAAANGRTQSDRHIQPNMNRLTTVIARGKDAVLSGRKTYMIELGD